MVLVSNSGLGAFVGDNSSELMTLVAGQMNGFPQEILVLGGDALLTATAELTVPTVDFGSASPLAQTRDVAFSKMNQTLQTFAADSEFVDKMEQVSGKNLDPEKLQNLKQDWLTGELIEFPKPEIVSQSEDDTATVVRDGQTVVIEQAANTVTLSTPDANSDFDGTLGTATNWDSFIDGTRFTSDSIGFDGDQNDYFRFRITNNRTNVNWVLSGLSANADLELIQDSNNNGRIDFGETIDFSNSFDTFADSVSQILDTGDYFIRVLPGISSAETNYNLSIRTTNLSGTISNIWRYDQGGRTDKGIDSSKETVVIIHGWNNSDQSSNIQALGKEASEFAPQVQVLALDWSSIAQDGLDWRVSVPYETASWIAPVARWTKERLEKLGIDSNQLTLIGHSLGTFVSAEIGKLFGKVKNLVALDPAAPANTYDIDRDVPQRQSPPDFRDVAQKSVAFVVVDTSAGVLGDNNKAATAHDSFLMRFRKSFYLADEAHGAVVDAFTDALDRRLLTLPDLNLPSHVDNWYDNNGDVDNWFDRRFSPGQHEGTITAVWTGNPLSWRITGLRRVVNSSGTEQITWTYT